jgi:hypothetical protein
MIISGPVMLQGTLCYFLKNIAARVLEVKDRLLLSLQLRQAVPNPPQAPLFDRITVQYSAASQNCLTTESIHDC